MAAFLIVAEVNLQLVWVILQVAAGLGAVIFVHELGHFLVAKACGVKCEKFYIGFDFGGLKLFHRQWGETEYGIGILPLGGYVKMLGQDDNPAKIAAETERARASGSGPQSTGAGADAAPAGGADTGLNPRSYLAKSVPQRMAIISAGVVMNVIFAVVFAATAYWLGVKYLPCEVSDVIPGSPAWQAGLEIGDEIVQIQDLKNPRFRDLRTGISLNDPEQLVPIKVKRPGQEQLLSFNLRPDPSRGIPTIGIKSPRALALYPDMPYIDGSPAARAEPALAGGDRVVAAGGEPVGHYRDLVRILAKHPDQPLELTVVRAAPGPDAAESSAAPAEELTVRLDANPMRRFGLIMECGPITAVRAGSPAAEAGLRPGDRLVSVDDEPVGDPVTLPERLRRLAVAGRPVRLGISREAGPAGPEQLTLEVALRQADWYAEIDMTDTPASALSLGIAYDIPAQIAAIDPAGPAARYDIRPGDEIVEARFVAAPDDTSEQAHLLVEMEPIRFGPDKRNWPALLAFAQRMPPGTQVRLTIHRGDQTHDVELAPQEADGWFQADRGLVFAPVERMRKAGSLAEAVALGGRETEDALLMVYRFLQRIIQQHISPRMLGGPVMIAKMAGASAYAGPAALLIFLTVLSANLAVINFLPIPVLDGGHMIFLAFEGIFRRPVSERFVVALHTIGFVLIVGLMLFVIGLDLNLIPRGL